MFGYDTISLYKKIYTVDKNKVLNGFVQYYRGNADNKDKYTNKYLDDEIAAHIKYYGETQLFNDGELVQLMNDYLHYTMNDKKWIDLYPELFI